MSFSRTDLLCFATLPDDYSFEERIAGAARAGFTELSLWLTSIDAARDELGSLQAVRECLDRHGMRATGLEILLAWSRGDGETVEEEIEVMAAAAEVFEPEFLLAGCMDSEIDNHIHAVELLRRQCRALAPYPVAVEFLPWSALPNLPAARALVEAVDEPNLGYVLDTWHFARSGQDFDALTSIPGDRILFLQLSDAGSVTGEDLITETLGSRLSPREGIVDWDRLGSLLVTMGVDCPMGTEQFSNSVKAMPLELACDYLYRGQKAAFPG